MRAPHRRYPGVPARIARPSLLLAVLLASVVAPPVASAQSAPRPSNGSAPGAPSPSGASAPDPSHRGNAAAGTLHAPLRAVDQGRDDLGGLATSFRMEPLDLRLPTGFGRVYEVPGEDSDAPGGRLMRGNGALFAIFPRSTYRFDANGPRASVPPGTVFSIGMPGPSALDLKPAATPAQGAVDARVPQIPFAADARATQPLEATQRSETTPRSESRSAAASQSSPDPRFPSASTIDPYAALALGPSCAATAGER
jgi:hypothetical protein